LVGIRKGKSFFGRLGGGASAGVFSSTTKRGGILKENGKASHAQVSEKLTQVCQPQYSFGGGNKRTFTLTAAAWWKVVREETTGALDLI